MGAVPYTSGIRVPIGKPSVLMLPGLIYCGRLYGVLFDTSKSFLLPEAIRGIRGLKRYYDEHRGLSVLVVGHADRAGDDAYNLTLSQERADSIASYLQDKVDDWMAWYRSNKPVQKRWSVIEDRYMLSALADAEGPYLPTGSTGDNATSRAISRFQRAKKLPGTGTMTEATRRALVTDYMAQDETTLPAGTPIETLGLGEFHPEVPTADGVAKDENRRVEIFLFEGPIAPPAVRPVTKPGSKEYPIWRARTVEDRDLRVPLGEAIFRMRKADKPAPGLRLLIRHPNGHDVEHTTDDRGEVRCVGLPDEVFHLICVFDGDACVALSSFDVTNTPG
jgi:hypothetical protein